MKAPRGLIIAWASGVTRPHRALPNQAMVFSCIALASTSLACGGYWGPT